LAEAAVAAAGALTIVETKSHIDDADGSTTAAGSESEQEANPLLDAVEDQAPETISVTQENVAAKEEETEEVTEAATDDNQTCAAEAHQIVEDSQMTDAQPSPPHREADLAEDQIIYALAKLLKHMARETTISSPPGQKTCFHSVKLPKVSLCSYASRIHKYFRCTDECFVLCLVYIDRIVKHNPDVQVTDLTCHRLLLTGCMVAAKFHDDEYASNEYFARVGGIDTSELNSLEVEFLKLLNWKLYVRGSEYDWFLQTLRRIP
jgi:hypothetical protein